MPDIRFSNAKKGELLSTVVTRGMRSVSRRTTRCSLVRVSETLSGVENETSWERT